jgi:hypothetical protein
MSIKSQISITAVQEAETFARQQEIQILFLVSLQKKWGRGYNSLVPPLPAGLKNGFRTNYKFNFRNLIYSSQNMENVVEATKILRDSVRMNSLIPSSLYFIYCSFLYISSPYFCIYIHTLENRLN